MYKLRPYQTEAVKSAVVHFRKQRGPAVIVLPTGAGKSLVIAELARIAKGRVLVLAHVKELVEQNYAKYVSYGLRAGIYSAGLDRKDSSEKVIFGSIQSVARAKKEFFAEFSLLIIDECHRVSLSEDTQYAQVIRSLRTDNTQLCILGLTATPYRLGLGWIYQYHHRGVIKTDRERFFKKCVFELSLQNMINNGYLTQPIKIDAPVACYDFSQLKLSSTQGSFALAEVEKVLKDQSRITPVIVENIIEMAHDRQGVMIFTSSVRHAEEIFKLLPQELSAIVVGETEGAERDDIIRRFKQRELKFLVNVSVLTTGFDAPHVDVIAILRPTESVSLYQQIIGRGLRLSPGKEDCLILDYTGQGHDLFRPEIEDSRPCHEAQVVQINCPMCGHDNEFWGIVDDDGDVVEHFGRKCKGAAECPDTLKIERCSYFFRSKLCPRCDTENDIAARVCSGCKEVLVDPDKSLREAMSLKDAHVMRPDFMELHPRCDRRQQEFLEIRYYDCDGNHLKEFHYLNGRASLRAFNYGFLRMHLRRPEAAPEITSVEDVVRHQNLLRLPMFIIARKKKQFWEIREKVFL